jgi:hypothetical protein
MPWYNGDMDNKTFYRVDLNETNGCSLQAYLPGLSAEKLTAALGPGTETTYADPDKGYGGPEWAFRRGDEVFSVYSRWGEYRVGGRTALLFDEPRGTADFVEWVRFQCSDA